MACVAGSLFRNVADRLTFWINNPPASKHFSQLFVKAIKLLGPGQTIWRTLTLFLRRSNILLKYQGTLPLRKIEGENYLWRNIRKCFRKLWEKRRLLSTQQGNWQSLFRMIASHGDWIRINFLLGFVDNSFWNLLVLWRHLFQFVSIRHKSTVSARFSGCKALGHDLRDPKREPGLRLVQWHDSYAVITWSVARIHSQQNFRLACGGSSGVWITSRGRTGYFSTSKEILSVQMSKFYIWWVKDHKNQAKQL